MHTNTIVLITEWFGELPEYFKYWWHSAGNNSTVNFMFFSDQEEPIPRLPNVRWIRRSFESHKQYISDKLGIPVALSDPSKLTDLRPTYGHLYMEELRDSDFWGWSSIDTVLGDLRGYYSDVMLERYDSFSTREDCISNGMFIVRNTDTYNVLYSLVKDYEPMIPQEERGGVDTLRFARFFIENKQGTEFSKPHWMDDCFNEVNSGRRWIDYTHSHPGHFIWRDGLLTHTHIGGRYFPYVDISNIVGLSNTIYEEIDHRNTLIIDVTGIRNVCECHP